MVQLELVKQVVTSTWLWTKVEWVYPDGTRSLVWEGLTEKWLEVSYQAWGKVRGGK